MLFMDKQNKFNWLDIFLSVSAASGTLKGEIYQFIANLKH